LGGKTGKGSATAGEHGKSETLKIISPAENGGFPWFCVESLQEGYRNQLQKKAMMRGDV